MGSIGIDQWRCRIGGFSISVATHRLDNTRKGALKCQNQGQVLLIMAMILIYANITDVLLVRAGVEQNPGPTDGINHGKLR